MSKPDKIKIGLLGLGTVGSGVYKLIEKQKEEFCKKAGADVEIVKILVHNMEKKREGVDPSLLTDNWRDIIDNDEIQLVIEVMGGIEPARTMILDALNAGKNVVSANKDLIAEHGKELLDAAEEHGVDFLFEAAVAGGIPIIRPLKQCLAANEIDEVIGIMNGTTNYILTKMFEDNMDFDEALAKATELGYAEADPTADIEGLDAGRKAAILASIAFHSRVVFKDVYTEGITKISSRDIAYAKEFGNVIKLLGVAHNTEDGIEVGVYPMMISQNHPLASVRDSFNAVFVQYHCTGRISCTCYRTTPVKDFKNVKNKFFLRMQVENKPGVLASIAMVFGVHKVSITKVMQKEQCENADVAELVIVTEAVKESQMLDSLEHLKDMETIREVSSVIREY